MHPSLVSFSFPHPAQLYLRKTVQLNPAITAAASGASIDVESKTVRNPVVVEDEAERKPSGA